VIAHLIGGPRDGETREVTLADLYVLVPGLPGRASAADEPHLPDMHRYKRVGQTPEFRYEGVDHLTPKGHPT
jgi:hypothetical protein